ncbi:MAG: hypothetical protein KGJ23_13850 [Euryarchaeota archaeon]|nr:hypothetical protein [Euryarchaeota archaeon]MDE1882046.1 hypothetical protein [Euryarchaeota archaeon]MDE2045989.1 hypothetical protein [Thermoplasmata archaeon]
MHLLYRARTFFPAPLSIVESLWLRCSQLGDSFDPPPGSWDEVERTSDGGVLRTIHRPRLGWTYHCTARREGPRALVLDVRIKKGRLLLAHLQSTEAIFAAGHQTSWDVAWEGEPGPGLAKLAWGRVAARLTRELHAEARHREHRLIEEVVKTPWGRAALARSDPLTPSI